jgi:putative toxin-antitoxin system antitoxin component (TIGR02293 family)
MSTLPPEQQPRYLEVLDAAKRLYGGDIDAAMHWMSRLVKAFGGKTPADMVTSNVETETAIGYARRLEHGFVA